MFVIDVTLDPILFEIGPFQMSWHGLIATTAILVAVWIGLALARRSAIPESSIGRLMWWAIPGGLIGARLFSVLDHLPYYSDNPIEVLFIWQGGIAAYGAFIGGLVSAVIAARRQGLPVWRLLDVAAPALLIGQAIGRIGCFLNGDTVGGPTAGGWGVAYWHPDALVPRSLTGIPTHPYPLYEIIWDLAVLGLVVALPGTLRQPGTRFLIAAIGYAIGRFVLSFFRMEPIVLWGLQEAQVIALVTGLTAVVVLLLRSRGSKDFSSVQTRGSVT